MNEEQLKISIEIHVVGDGRTFLNFWDFEGGEDVIAEIKKGKLFTNVNGVDEEISLQRFIDDVKRVVSNE